MPPFQRLTASILETDRVTDEIKRFTLKLSAPMPFRHGQFVNVRFPGEARYHAFSIASSQAVEDKIELYIKRERDFTRKLFESPNGTQLELMGPLGPFTDEAKMQGDVVMLAGGVGVTPLLSVVRWARDFMKQDRHYWLVYSCKTRSDIIHEQELRDMTRMNPNIHLVLTLTREQPADWEGELGRVDEAMLRKHLGSLDGKTYYICGPTAMVEGSKDTLLRAGVPPESIQMESWG